MFGAFHGGAVVVSIVAASAMLAWRNYTRLPLLRYVPRELVAVVTGIGCTLALQGTSLGLGNEHRVHVPLLSQIHFGALWQRPDITALARPDLWQTALVLAIVASIESLLCVEATDQIDPQRQISPPNRELVAQGLGNVVSGLLGGLPVTAVVVRSFANTQAGARTRWASVFHGVLLLVATVLLGSALNLVPLASLAVVLIAVAYKLTKPALYREVLARGHQQFVPFVATVVSILFTDLLRGTLLGVVFATLYVLWAHYHSALVVIDDGRSRFIRLAANVSFLHKVRIKDALSTAVAGAHVVVDGTRARSVDIDVLDLIQDFERHAAKRGVMLSIRRSPSAFHGYFREETA
jgi:MFS superfamily sulfate permease-like transporter